MKITHYTMNEGNLNLNKKRESTGVNGDDTDLGLFDKDLKAVIKVL